MRQHLMDTMSAMCRAGDLPWATHDYFIERTDRDDEDQDLIRTLRHMTAASTFYQILRKAMGL